ncbi:MAG: M1 family metallopeptidase [Holophagales bacterium]|nr:MAG: M1 family metallopeptidase [Holophagales bacterium]
MRAAASALALVLGILPSHDARADATAPRVASYDLAARLDAEEHRIEASGTLRWRNPSALPADRLCFHLYLNAFRDERSSFLREADPAVADELAASGWGGIDLRHLRDESGRDLADRLVFAAPDDGNAADATLAWVDLARPVPPGGELTLTMEWTARLPALVDRAGQLGHFVFAGQWFPKIGRRRADGAWSCHQHHATSEFSADFGDYRVALDLPAGWEVGATGAAAAPASETAGRRQIAFAATGVHDFAWSASPDWSLEETALPRAAAPAVQLRLLLQPASRRLAARLVATLTTGLERFEALYGRYPHDTLTVVEPPPGGDAATAMEYPSLFTMMVAPLPTRSLELEETALHELVHQWWQGVVATDEVEEPFLDEGLATYASLRVLAERWHGAAPGLRLLGWSLPLPGQPLDPFEQLRLRWRGSDLHGPGSPVDPIARPAWSFRDAESYGTLVYDGAALAFLQLERLIGRDAFDRGLAQLATRQRHAHPTSADFVRALSAAAGEDLSPLWEELMGGTGSVDYAVADATSEPDESGGSFASTATIERRGERRLPVEIELRFADGSTRRAVWDGRERWARLRIVGPPLVDVRLDPQRRLVLDADRLDDSFRLAPDPRPRRAVTQRLRFLLQLLLEALADLA